MQTTKLKGFHLSQQQARLWDFQHECGTFHVGGIVQLEGPLDIQAFLQALQKMLERHSILRTTFRIVSSMDVPLQIITDGAQVACPLIDMGNLARAVQDEELQTCYALQQTRTINFARHSLMHVTIWRLSSCLHSVALDLPALCADAMTLRAWMIELSQLYAAIMRGVPLDDEPLQYVDVSAWQDELLQRASAEELQHWMQFDLSRLTVQPLPLENGQRVTDLTAPFKPQAYSVALPETLHQRLFHLAQRQEVSMEACLLACWQGLLWRLLGKSEFLLGVLCHGRIDEELEAVPGLYTRSLPMRVALDNTLTLEHALHLAHAALQEAQEEQTYFSWERVQKAEQKTHSLVFPLSFEYIDYPQFFDTGTGLHIVPDRFYATIEPYMLKLSIWQRGTDLQISLYYDQSRIECAQVEQLAKMFLTFMQGSVERPAALLMRQPLLTVAEQRHVASLLRGPTVSFPALAFQQLFEKQVERVPEQMAVISDDMQMTYRELNSRANHLARILRGYNVGPNVPVGLCVTRSATMILGMLAILKAGGAYVPLDVESPADRLLYQLQDVQAPVVLTQQRLLPLIPAWSGLTLSLEELESRPHEQEQEDLPVQSCLSDLAYIIYTSGSSGVPKGVPILQRSVSNYAQALCRLLHVETGWQYATVSTLAADLGNTAIFCALASGGCLQVLDYETVISADMFERWISCHSIDVLKITPSHLSALLNSEAARKLLPGRVLLLGGEALPAHLVKRIRSLDSTCDIYNHYGPTETTVGVLVNALGKQFDETDAGHYPESATIPLGTPIANTAVYVLDRGQQMVPPGMVGELYIGGPGLSPGYLHQAEQTALRFVPQLFEGQAGERLYRSGDLVRYTSQGMLEFIGRSDNQVKLRGYRIELGEIEAIIRQHENVRDVVVLLREDIAGEHQLVAYVVLGNRSKLTDEMLRSYVRERVPAYMIPSAFVWLDALPLTANGKVDRRSLPIPDYHQTTSPVFSARPSSPVEEILLEIWRDLLGMPVLDVDENFFQLGGHSLLATQMIARVRMILQVDLSIQKLFEGPTIAQLTRWIELALHGDTCFIQPELVPVARSGGAFPLSFAQQRIWFLDRLDPGNTSYLIPRMRRLSGELNYRLVEQSLAAMFQRHEVLRTTFREQNGQPVQVIEHAAFSTLPLIDLMGLEPDKRPLAAKALLRQETQQSCDLSNGPLIRSRLVRLAPEEHLLLLTMHHIITDGWSNDIFFHEIVQLYQAFAMQLPSPLVPLPIQYADYAVWQRQVLQGEFLETQLHYWRKQLDDVPVLALSTDYPRPSRRTFRGSTLSIRLPASVREDLLALSKQEGVTLFMTLLAVFTILLRYYSGQSDICVGTPIANRSHQALEGLIGLFINTLVLRTRLPEAATFHEILHRVRETCIGAYAHQDLPFDLLVETLQPQRHPDYSPFFQVMFMLEHRPGMSAPTQEAVEQIVNLEYELAKFDLTLGIIDTSTDLLVKIEYSTDLFDRKTIERMLGEYQQLLLLAVSAPHQPLQLSLQMQERADLIKSFNENLEE